MSNVDSRPARLPLGMLPLAGVLHTLRVTRLARLITAAVALCLLVASLVVSGYRLDEPGWEGSHQGFNFTVFANITGNLHRYGFVDAKGGMIRHYGESANPSALPRYVNHPFLNVWMQYLSGELLGRGAWAIRLPATLSSAALVGLVYWAGRRRTRWLLALVALVFTALLPIRAVYARMPDSLMPATFFTLLTVCTYFEWRSTKRLPWLIVCLFSLVAGCWTDWNAYFVVPPILMHYVFTSRLRESMRVVVTFLLAPVLCFAVHLAWTYANGGPEAMRALTGQFLFRVASEGHQDAYLFTSLEYFGTLRDRATAQLTPTVICLASVWMLALALKALRRRSWAGHGPTAVLLVAWAGYIAVFSNVAIIHDYHMLYSGIPFFSLAAAEGIDAISSWFPRSRRFSLLILTAVALYFFIPQAVTSLHAFNIREPAHVEEVVAGLELNSLSEPDQVLLFSSAPPYPRMRYYLDRQYRVVRDTEALESELSAIMAPPLYVLDADTELPGAFRRYLFERFPVEQVESYSVFDLSAHSGSTFEQVPVVGVSSPSPESPIELFDARVSPEVVTAAPEPSWWERYLNAHPELLPENQTRLLVTYAWRVLEQPDQDYSVITKLVHVLTGESVLEARREPFSGNLPTTVWRAGEAVREQFELVLPPGAPPGRYRLEVELQDAQGKPVRSFDEAAGGLPHLRVALDSPAVSVGTLPRDCVALSHAFSPSLELAGWCPAPEYVDVYWRTSEPTEETYAGTLVLTAEGLSLEQDVGILTASAWHPGELYHTRTALSSGLLPGEYHVQLTIKGDADTTASAMVDLGTHWVGGDAPPVLVRLGQPDCGGDRTMRIGPQDPLTLKVSLEEQRDLDLVIGWTGESQLPKTRVQVWLDNDTWVWTPKLLRTLVLPRGRPSETLMRVPGRLTVSGENRVTVRVAKPGEAYLGWRLLAVTLVPNLKHLIRDSYQPYTGWVDADFVDLRLAGQPRNGDELTGVANFYESQGLFSSALEFLRAAISSSPVEASSAERLRLARLHRGLGATDEAVEAYREVLTSVSVDGPLSGDDREVLTEALHNLASLADGPEERRTYEEALKTLIPSYSPQLLGDTVWYLGHEVAATEQSRRIRLYLVPAATPTLDYRVWMHARPDDLELLPKERQQYGFLNLDHQPPEPTSSWVAGRLYVDERNLDLEDTCYDLSFGFWHSQSGSRLLLDSGGQGISVGQVCGRQAPLSTDQAAPGAADQLILARLFGALGMQDRAEQHYRAVADLLGAGQHLGEHGRHLLIEALWHLQDTADDGSSPLLADVVPHYAPVTLGGTIRYLGYEATVDGGRVMLRLYLVPLRHMESDYRIWMHAVPDDERVLPKDRQEHGFLNLDHYPTQPTSSWTTDRPYVHIWELSLEEACYNLRFGFWCPEDGSRLLTPDADHGVTLGEVCLG